MQILKQYLLHIFKHCVRVNFLNQDFVYVSSS